MCVAEIGWPDSHGMMAGLRIYVQPCLDPVALTGLRGCLGRAPKPTMEGGGGDDHIWRCWAEGGGVGVAR